MLRRVRVVEQLAGGGGDGADRVPIGDATEDRRMHWLVTRAFEMIRNKTTRRCLMPTRRLAHDAEAHAGLRQPTGEELEDAEDGKRGLDSLLRSPAGQASGRLVVPT